MSNMDYYKTLGIEKNADETAIKKAYRKLALKWHPDKAPADKKKEYEEKFKNIAEAYSVLSDKEKRKIYDQFGKAGLDGSVPSNGHGMPGGFPAGATFHFSTSDGNVDPRKIFEQFFGNKSPFSMHGDDDDFPFSGFMNQRQRVMKGDLVRHVINVSLEDVFTGRTKTLKIPGENNQSKIIKVNIPKSCESGGSVVYKNAVFAGEGVIPSDLQIIINVKKHSIFTRDGSDLHMKINIMSSEATDGIYRELNMIDGTKYVLNLRKIPESDYVHIIKGKGLYVVVGEKEIGRADLYVHFNVKFV